MAVKHVGGPKVLKKKLLTGRTHSVKPSPPKMPDTVKAKRLNTAVGDMFAKRTKSAINSAKKRARTSDKDR